MFQGFSSGFGRTQIVYTDFSKNARKANGFGQKSRYNISFAALLPLALREVAGK